VPGIGAEEPWSVLGAVGLGLGHGGLRGIGWVIILRYSADIRNFMPMSIRCGAETWVAVRGYVSG
jgi:hypothetical protein